MLIVGLFILGSLWLLGLYMARQLRQSLIDFTDCEIH